MPLKPLLEEGDTIIHTDSNTQYKIKGDRAILTIGMDTFKISLYKGYEKMEGFETGNYEIVKYKQKPKAEIKMAEQPTESQRIVQSNDSKKPTDKKK